MATPRNMLDQHTNAIIAKLIERALADNLTALKLCVKRTLPRNKQDNGIRFDLPDDGIDSYDNTRQIAKKNHPDRRYGRNDN